MVSSPDAALLAVVQVPVRGVFLSVGYKFRSSNAIVALPADILATATYTIHGHPFRAWRNVHNLPIARCTIVGLADTTTLGSTTVVVFRFFANILFIATIVVMATFSND